MYLRDHSQHSTYSPGKRRAEQRTFLVFENARFHRRTGCAVLVGCAEGLVRHLKNCRKLGSGFSVQSVTVVERDWATFKGLLQEAHRINAPCKFFYGNMSDYLKNHTPEYLDFDACAFDRDARKTLRLARQKGIPYITAVCSSRRRPKREIFGFIRQLYGDKYAVMPFGYRGVGTCPMLQIDLRAYSTC